MVKGLLFTDLLLEPQVLHVQCLINRAVYNCSVRGG